MSMPPPLVGTTERLEEDGTLRVVSRRVSRGGSPVCKSSSKASDAEILADENAI
jgi:hypothetical protein